MCISHLVWIKTSHWGGSVSATFHAWVHIIGADHTRQDHTPLLIKTKTEDSPLQHIGYNPTANGHSVHGTRLQASLKLTNEYRIHSQ